MPQSGRQSILSSAKPFFRTHIAENHQANTEKLTNLRHDTYHTMFRR